MYKITIPSCMYNYNFLSIAVNLKNIIIKIRVRRAGGGGKKVRGHKFFPRAVEISFLDTRGCGNAIPVKNEGI